SSVSPPRPARRSPPRTRRAARSRPTHRRRSPPADATPALLAPPSASAPTQRGCRPAPARQVSEQAVSPSPPSAAATPVPRRGAVVGSHVRAVLAGVAAHVHSLLAAAVVARVAALGI